MTDDSVYKAGIGILGGTFDPIHLGHLAVARTVKDQFKLERVHIIPAFKNPLRQHEEIISGTQDRLVMAHLATLDEPWLQVDSLEIERGRHSPGPSYSIDTLNVYRMRYPGVPLTFIVGADNAAFHHWLDIGEFPKLVKRIVVVSRPEYEVSFSQNLREVSEICPAIRDIVEFVPTLNIPISSTAVRDSLRAGEMPEDYLHPAVKLYIRKYRLYGWKDI